MILPEIPVASENCQRWAGGKHSFRHTSEGGFDPARYAVEDIDELTAKRYVIENHYSGSYPASSRRYGLFEADKLVGVMVLGIPVQTKTLTSVFPDLEPFVESLELSRFVLNNEVPGNAESWFLARGFEAAAATGIRGVVSFADPVPRMVGGEILFPGHVGTIYQATNAIYGGRGTGRTLTLLPNGEVFNDRAKQKVRGQERGHEHVERKLIALGAPVLRAGQNPTQWLNDALTSIGTRLRHRGCHRYVFPVGTRS